MYTTRRHVNLSNSPHNSLQGITLYGFQPEIKIDALKERLSSPDMVRLFTTACVENQNDSFSEIKSPSSLPNQRFQCSPNVLAHTCKTSKGKPGIIDKLQTMALFRGRKKKVSPDVSNFLESEKNRQVSKNKPEGSRYPYGFVKYFYFDAMGQESGYSLEAIKYIKIKTYTSKRTDNLICSLYDPRHKKVPTGCSYSRKSKYKKGKGIHNEHEKPVATGRFCSKHSYLNAEFSLEDFQIILDQKKTDMKLKSRLLRQLKFFFDSTQSKLHPRQAVGKYRKYVAMPKMRGRFVKKHCDLGNACGHIGSWTDIQNAYMGKKSKARNQGFLLGSCLKKCPSDSVIDEFNTDKQEMDMPVKSHSDTTLNYPATDIHKMFSASPDSVRFDYSHNERYCQVASSLKPNFEVSLYMTVQSEDDDLLCHVKTDLLSCALREFFFPYEKVQVQWVDNLDNLLEELLDSGAQLIPHIRSGLDTLRRGEFRAVLHLSADASVMLRHRDLQFLDAITSTLEIKRKELLILKN